MGQPKLLPVTNILPFPLARAKKNNYGISRSRKAEVIALAL